MTTKRSPQEEAPSCPNCHRNIEHDLAIEMAYCSACGKAERSEAFSSAMMARAFIVSSSWLARGSRISPQTQWVPWTRRARVMTTCSPRIITGLPPPAVWLALSTIPIALWQVPMDIFGFIFPPWGEPSKLFLQAKATEPEGSPAEVVEPPSSRSSLRSGAVSRDRSGILADPRSAPTFPDPETA